MQRLLFWSPRIAGIFAIVFLSIFALDAFPSGGALPDALLSFAVHLVPSLVLVALLAFAWRFEFAGGVLFLAVSLAPFIALNNPYVVNLMLGAPLALTGLLFVTCRTPGKAE